MSTILIANVANLSRFVTSHFDSKRNSSLLRILSLFIIYDWSITIIEDSEHELSTVNMLYSLKKLSYSSPTSP